MPKLRSDYLKRKWVKVLDSDIGEPIRTVKEASELAVLYESEVKLNKGWYKYSLECAERLDRIDKVTKGLYTKYFLTNRTQPKSDV